MVKEIHSILSSKMEPICRILDDAELEKQGKFREWREDTQTISAKRIFGSPGSSVPKSFPKAFQNYKPSFMKDRVIPQVQPQRLEHVILREEDNELIQSVRQLLKLTPLTDTSGCLLRPSTPLIGWEPIARGDELHASLQNETRSE